MADDPAWKDHSGGGILQYDFAAPGHWTGERMAQEQAAIAAAINADDVDAGPAASPPAPGWLALARRLPAPLRAALGAELRAGNQLTGIGSAGWPDAGSIVVTVRARFSVARQAPPGGVRWRAPEDPHYAREELSQRVGPVEFLILA